MGGKRTTSDLNKSSATWLKPSVLLMQSVLVPDDSKKEKIFMRIQITVNDYTSTKSSDDLLGEFKTKYPNLTVQSLIGNSLSHGCMCPDYFAKAMVLALQHALNIPGLEIDPGWTYSAGHGIDAILWFDSIALTLELKWSCVAEVGTSIGWQWKTLANQKKATDIVILFGHLAFQPWMENKSPKLVREAQLEIPELLHPPPHLDNHPATWFNNTKVLIYDSSQFHSKQKNDEAGSIPPAKLQLIYKRKFKGMNHKLHPMNHIIHCTDLKKIRTTLINACTNCTKDYNNPSILLLKKEKS